MNFKNEDEGYQDLYQIAMINDLRNQIDDLIFIKTYIKKLKNKKKKNSKKIIVMMLYENKTDYEIINLILKTSNTLKIDDIIEMLSDRSYEDGAVEFIPLIHVTKDSLEKTLRCLVLLASWEREENIKIRKISDPQLYKNILTNLRSIDVDIDNILSFTEEEDMEKILSLISNLLRIQYYIHKWLTYLYASYEADIGQMINFIFN